MTLHSSTSAQRDTLLQQLASAPNGTVDIHTLSPAARPHDKDTAYALQSELLRAWGAQVGGWKVGAKSPGGAANAAPLLAQGVHRSGQQLARSDFPILGIELEIAFRLDRTFAPQAGTYPESEVASSIGSMLATIEIVSSRYRAWPDIDVLLQLADFQNHGALIVGEDVPFAAEFPFLEPSVSLTFDGADVLTSLPRNPAGDPRSLLTWLVNHVTSRGMSLEAGTLMTTGSYTGMYFPREAGVVLGRIAGLPAVSLVLA